MWHSFCYNVSICDMDKHKTRQCQSSTLKSCSTIKERKRTEILGKVEIQDRNQLICNLNIILLHKTSQII